MKRSIYRAGVCLSLLASTALVACSRATPPAAAPNAGAANNDTAALTSAWDAPLDPSPAVALTPVRSIPAIPLGQLAAGPLPAALPALAGANVLPATILIPPGSGPGTGTPLPSMARMDGSARAAFNWPPDTQRSLDAKLLVVAAERNEPALAAMQAVLDGLGTPYDVWIARENPGGLLQDKLATGNHGLYAGVVLTQAEPSYLLNGTWQRALSEAERQALQRYEKSFGVRQLSWYSWPTAELGFGPPGIIDTSEKPLPVVPTVQGAAVFAPLRAAARIDISHAYAYAARPLDNHTTPLLVDNAGHALAAIHTFEDGRENLVVTFDSNPTLLHTWLLAYGALRWVSHGLLLGEHRPTLTLTVDDCFSTTPLWHAQNFRLGGADLTAIAAWQQGHQADPQTNGLTLELALNGAGVTPEVATDGLAAAATRLASHFRWGLEAYPSQASAAGAIGTGLADGRLALDRLKLTQASQTALVNANGLGLEDAGALQAAATAGVRYLVTDAGLATCAPNTGIVSPLQPPILQVPRHANNLFYDVSTPAQWVDEYNTRYRSYWGHDFDYAGLLELESDALLLYILRADADPWVFSQANLRAYDGVHSLLGDLLDRTLAKYESHTSAPLAFPSLQEVGQLMTSRMAYNQAGVAGRIVAGTSLAVGALGDVSVPVIGLSTGPLAVRAHQVTTVAIPGPAL